VSEERRRADDHLNDKLDQIVNGVNEMKTALFGPAYDPKMGFIYRTEARLKDQDTRIENLEKAHWKQTGIVATVLAGLEILWNLIKSGFIAGRQH